MVDQEDLIEKIKFLSDSIRKKSRDLKAGIQERDRYLQTTFEPVVKPLKEMSENIKTRLKKDEELQSLLPTDEKNSADIANVSKEVNAPNLTGVSESDDDEEEEEEEGEEEDYNDIDVSTKTASNEQSISNTSILASNIGNKGQLTRKYILKMLEGPPVKRKCHVYGARLENKNIMIGDSTINIDDSDNITVKGKTYQGTPGLFELIFKAVPTRYTTRDIKHFKQILKTTNAHRKGYSVLAPVYRNKSKKYGDIIAKLFPPRNAKSGHGISMKSAYDTNIIYYNDVNKLVNRLRLLHESKQAGHTGLDNEIIALTHELRNQGYIE
jgi:hypothetical protein